MVGYCANGYRLWCPEDNKIILGRDVIFTEFIFNFENRDFYDSKPQDPIDLAKEEPSNSGRVVVEEEEVEEEEVEEEEVESDNTNASRKQDVDVRKSTRIRNKPKYFEDYTVLALCAESFVEDVPEHFDDIQGRDDKEQRLRAVDEEMASLIENKT